MSASEEQQAADDEPKPEPAAAAPDSEPADEADSTPRLRRRLLGARPADVRAALAEREQEITELRRDVTALWLAFGQHERTIQQLLATLERLAGIEIPAPGGRARSTPEPPAPEAAPAPAPEAAPAGSISEQLSDLDQVLAAIEQATQSLEQAYEDELTAPEGTGGDETSNRG